MTSDKPLRIMGIDPGTNRMGYGVLEVKGSSVSCIAMGDIELGRLPDAYAKLHHIFERVSGLIEAYAPDEVALESPFFGENVQSMLKLGRAQGCSDGRRASPGGTRIRIRPSANQTVRYGCRRSGEGTGGFYAQKYARSGI